ncbi:DUF421 domain-containing protein [Pedobacter sp. SYP-B3415]|uniref:DUF421 domain-containing protein n=1 Tax=Pedobacter sp. SYP-B3415 TaxID=2496641 RepID=UPI00101DB135|nr:YetF domain-containing protein [Pedobacter sp. SYP-B3415]
MKELELFDPKRLFLGEVPGMFYLEVILRSAFIFFMLILAMRLMGKRMSSQLSRNEMAAVSSLAAAIGVPLMNPERGVLPGLIVAVVIVAWQMLIAKWSLRRPKFETLSQDDFNVLVRDGVMVCEEMVESRISRERLCAQLRSSEIYHLGQVSRLYLEAGGMFSLVKRDEPIPGLTTLPDWDKAFSEEVTEAADDKVCCWSCGKVYNADQQPAVCEVCQRDNWTTAVITKH